MTISSKGTPAPSDPHASSSEPARMKSMPDRWEGVVSAPISQNDGRFPSMAVLIAASIFLHSISQALDEHYIPTRRHFHLLLYIALTSPLSPIAIRTLAQAFSLCPPSALDLTIPVLTTKNDVEKGPVWARWNDGADTTGPGLSRDIRRFVMRAAGPYGGIWALLNGAQVKGSVQGKVERAEERMREAALALAGKAKSPVKRRNRNRGHVGDEDDTDGEEEEEGDVKVEEEEEEEELESERGGKDVICENGWKLLGLLVKLWKADQAEHTQEDPEEPWSPMFLQQLPQPFEDLAIADATRPFDILKAGMVTVEEADDNSPDRYQILEVSRDLLSLIIACTLPTGFIFHPPTLLINLLDLLRPLSPRALISAFSLLPLTLTLYAHVLVMVIEDLAGVRMKKQQERNRKSEVMRREFILDWSECPGEGQEKGEKNYPPPTIGYIRDILLLTSAGKSTEGEEKIKWAKSQLVTWAGINYGPKAEWGFGKDEEWLEKYNGMRGGGGEEGEDDVLALIQTLMVD